MEYPSINALAAKFEATPAQILLSWGVQRGTSVIPKSENVERMAKNLQVRRTYSSLRGTVDYPVR